MWGKIGHSATICPLRLSPAPQFVKGAAIGGARGAGIVNAGDDKESSNHEQE